MSSPEYRTTPQRLTSSANQPGGCDAPASHGYECNRTANRCESVPHGSHGANLTACDRECSSAKKGYKCDAATKRCEESSESKATMEECAHECEPKPTEGVRT